MPNNQEFIDPLPEDNRLWLVKYIDQYHIADGTGTSTAVYVLFQYLPGYSPQDISQLTPHKVQEILGYRKKTDERREFMLKRIMVGTLCAISTGDVFLNGKCEGRLPNQTRVVQLAPGESDSVEYTLGQPLEKPPEWRSERDYHILNAFEYCGLYDHRQPNVALTKSRVTVLHRKNGRDIHTYIIPRTVIFSSFYACHTLMANAFCSGQWKDTSNTVIALKWNNGEPATQIDPENGNWNIVVQMNIELRFAGLLAVLYLDDYGRTQANLIHAKNLSDRQADLRTPYYASARIPLQAVNEPLRLNLTYLQLRTSKYMDAEGVWHTSNKYLVTGICGASWPSHYPDIARNSVNSNDEGQHIETTAHPRPYGEAGRTKKSNSNTRIRSDADAKDDSTTTIIDGVPWDWLDDGPTYTQLEKKSSKRYTDKSPPPPAKNEGNNVSTGNRNHSKRSIPKGQASTTSQPDIDSFTAILEAFKTLKDDKVLKSTAFVQAARAGQRATTRNGYSCWKFIDEFSILGGHAPTKGWSTVYEFEEKKRAAYWRTALVLKIEFKGAFYYWIEIEARSSDYQSVLIKVREEDRMAKIEETLSIIARQKGRWLDKHLKRHFQDTNVGVRCYKHRKLQKKKNLQPEADAGLVPDASSSVSSENLGKLSVAYIEEFLNISAEELKDKAN